jgi:hypothetical protein
MLLFDILQEILYHMSAHGMEQEENKDEIYRKAREQHALLDRRLQVLLEKPYLTQEEEVEVRQIKKLKLYYKDTMERIVAEQKKGEGH